MSDRSLRGLRTHALAAATAAVLSASMFAAPAFAAGQGRVYTDGLQSATSHDRFIVKYRDGSAARSNAAALQKSLDVAANATIHGKALGLKRLRSVATGAEVVTTGRKLNQTEAAALMRQIAADPNVEYVEVDRILRSTLTPNDTNYGSQWHYFEATGGIKANEAWDVTNGAGVVVAVIDTGIATHSDLGANVLPGYDFISDAGMARDGNGRDSNAKDEGDWYAANECGGTHPASNSSWHGTHVAGTVAAVTNNAKGVAGVAYGAKIVPVRVLGKCGGYTSDIVDGIIWASGGTVSGIPANANPAEVINMSLGGGGACGATQQAAIDGAVSRGTTLAIAAGNDNANVSGYNPGNCNNVLSVAATDRQGARSSFSNYGSLIDFAAPGSGILSTLNSGATVQSTESYASYNGTSMAAPHVAGVVALMQAAATSPQTPAQIESILKSTARAFPSTPSQTIGAGIVNAKAAVDAVTGTTPPPTGGTLTKGVAKTGISAATGGYAKYTLAVPAGATNLTFTMSGGTGDADMYVRFGSEPTDSTYTCRPYLNGNAETCTIAAPSAGTYYVNLKAYSSFSGVSLVGDYSTGGGGGSQTYSNTSNYTINDNATVDSPITVSGRSGNAPSSTPVEVNIVHTYKGDLKVDLVAPDGSLYNLHNRSGGSADNVIGTATLNLSSEALNGTWKLRVNDNYNGDTGYINSWSITF
jgi:serine protease